jgi:hypothetical protein
VIIPEEAGFNTLICALTKEPLWSAITCQEWPRKNTE